MEAEKKRPEKKKKQKKKPKTANDNGGVAATSKANSEKGNIEKGNAEKSVPCESARPKAVARGSPQKPSENNTRKGPSSSPMSKNKVFAPYMSREDVDAGLKRGQLIKGELRINPRCWEEAYVPHPDGRSDVLLSGLTARNRALNSDVVVVRLNARSDWRVLPDQMGKINNGINLAPGLTAGLFDSVAGQSDDAGDDVIIEGESVETIDEFGVCTRIVTTPASVNADDVKTTSSTRDVAAPDVVNDAVQAKSGGAQKRYPIPLRVYRGGHVDDQYLQKTGQVVYIAERCHSRACAGTLKPMPDRNPNMALFVPADSRVTRICVPINDCPEDYRKNPASYASVLCVARITQWDDGNRMPLGTLLRSLGEAGEIETETEGALMSYDVDCSEFDQSVLDCLPETPWAIPEPEIQSRTDLRDQCIFTIDPATARDLDDALSCRVIDNGLYEVGVHIADVSYFLKEGTPLDDAAARRATSVYLVQKVIPMLPRLLCEQLCSLTPDQDKLTFSVIWKMTSDGQIVDEWFGKTVIRSRAKLSYQHAQKFIEQPDSPWSDDLPRVSDVRTGEQIRQAILDLHKFAVQLRADRFRNGALQLNQAKLTFTLNTETGLPSGCSVYEYKDSNKLIEEFMLLANIAVAHKLYKTWPDRALLRRHPEPQTKMVDELISFCRCLGVDIKGSTSADIQRCLAAEYKVNDDEAMARYHVITRLCTRPMQLALYFCTGSLADETFYRHYALNVPLYTHFTSPIRRYADVIVHRQLAAAIGVQTLSELSSDQINKQASRCNLKKNNARRVQELSSELFFSVFIKECGPLEREGAVIAVLDKSFDVLVLSLGVVKRVYCENLALKTVEYKKHDLAPELVLVWKDPEQRQEIRIFSRIMCTLSRDNQPLKWQMTVCPPEAR